jgi:hypothetical protein
MTFRPGTLGSEYGYLMETYPIALPGGLGISPYVIADEIIACRERKVSAYVNYGTVPWSGPFRNWSQFNLFVDNLVTVGALSDPRTIHKAYEEEGPTPRVSAVSCPTPAPSSRRSRRSPPS